jgi:Lar family restriction alleviation protein
MASEEQALPCPFCGSRVYGFNETSVVWVTCHTCRADGPSHETEAGALAAWNTRAPDEQQRAEARNAALAWQPIGTAPKGGGIWILAAEAGHPDLAYHAYAACWHSDGYWLANCGQHVTETPEPTHWMPLPKPPQATP